MKYLLLVLLVLVVGCNNQPQTNIPTNKTPRDIELITVDGCEYVVYSSTYHNASMVHHGNCHNPVHGVKSWGTSIDVDSVQLNHYTIKTNPGIIKFDE